MKAAIKRNVWKQFFDLFTTNRRLLKIFAKLNGNHLLVAKIFKLHEYQTFGSMKMHNMSKMWKPIINSVFETVWLTMNEPPKMLIFKLFPFSIFWISNDYFQKYCGKTTLFYNAFRMFLWSSTLLQIFLIYTFDNETTVLLKVSEICNEMHFVCLFFLYERNITASLLMTYLKCTVVHYANLNSNSISKPF